MDDIISEIWKGYLRAVGYILAEIFFNHICYWVGWLICKLLSFSKFPQIQGNSFGRNQRQQQYWCALVGFMAIVGIAIFLVV